MLWAEPSVGEVSGMQGIEAVQLSRSVVKLLGKSLGPIEVKSVDDPLRDPAGVSPNSPIYLRVGDSRVNGVPGVYSNCVAEVPMHEIICDLRVLDDLIDGFALLRNNEDREPVRRELLRLILAHELAHVVLRHPSAQYHGNADGFSVMKYVGYRIELEADRYAVELIERSATDAISYHRTIIDLAVSAVRRSVCPETFPAPCPCPGYTDATLCSRIPLGPGLLVGEDEKIQVTLSGTHPEFVVRFARLLFLSKDRRIRDIYGRQAERVLGHVVVKNEQGELEATNTLFR